MQRWHHPFVGLFGVFLISFFSVRVGADVALPQPLLSEKTDELLTPERLVLIRLQKELRFVLRLIEQAKHAQPSYLNKHIDYTAFDYEIRAMLRTVDSHLMMQSREPTVRSPLTYLKSR